MDSDRMCQCCGEQAWAAMCKICGQRKGHCCMVVHLMDGICYACSGPEANFILPAWCKAECEEHQKKKHPQPSTKKDQTQLGIVAELNQALPRDGKLFYDFELGGNSLMSYTAIEVAIVNEDKSKEYVKMVVNCPMMGKDEIRIMIHEPFKILKVQRPNDEGLTWLLEELFPHLRTPQSRLLAWKKSGDSVDREKERKRDASPKRNRQQDASLMRGNKSITLEEFKQRHGIQAKEPPTSILEAAILHEWQTGTAKDSATMRELWRKFKDVKIKCFHCSEMLNLAPDYIDWMDRGRCKECYRWACGKHVQQMFGRAIMHHNKEYQTPIKDLDIPRLKIGYGNHLCNACVAAGLGEKGLFENTMKWTAYE